MAHTPHSHSTLVFFSMCCEMILIFSLFSSRRLVAFFLLPTDRCRMVRTSPIMQPIHAQLPGPQLESYSASKARLPAHAQRINSLLASDKEFAS